MEVVSITTRALNETELARGFQGDQIVEIVLDEFPEGTDHIKIVCGGFNTVSRVIPVSE